MVTRAREVVAIVRDGLSYEKGPGGKRRAPPQRRQPRAHPSVWSIIIRAQCDAGEAACPAVP